METLHIKVKDKETYKHLLWFLRKFNSEELQVVENGDFETIQRELHEELARIDSGASDLVDIDDFDKELDLIISEYEN